MSNDNKRSILSWSSSGLGPKCDVAGWGVPAREWLAIDALRGGGGADIGLDVICNGGKGLPVVCGRISSRFTGIPSEMRCWRRIRDRFQLVGLIDGGCKSIL